MSKKVYLAGAITGLTYADGQDWRIYAKYELAKNLPNGKPSGIDGFSPLRAKDYLSANGLLTGSYEDFPLSTAMGIMTRDHWDVQTADLILVNLLGTTKVSVGTVMEIAWAFAYRKPLVLVMEKDNVHEHPMLAQATGFRVDNLDDAIKTIKAILLPG